jgi:hypothetical protein
MWQITDTPQTGTAARPPLAPGEIVLPALCAQTAKPFLIVARQRSRRVLTLVRAVAVAPARPAPSTTSLPAYHSIGLEARTRIGSSYNGCPHCRAHDYFYCRTCNLLSCWNPFNKKPHQDHFDIWCAGCRSWHCFSFVKRGKGPLHSFTAYVSGGNTTGPGIPTALPPGKALLPVSLPTAPYAKKG